MKKIINKDITLEKLAEFIEGSLNDTLKAEVSQWIQADDDNRAFYELFKKAWSDPQDLSELAKENKENDWKQISTVINNSDQISASGRTLLFHSRSWLRIAGVILLLIATALGYFAGRNHTRQSLSIGGTSYHEIIVPAGEKSNLTLSDGTRIWINAGSKIKFPNQFNNESRDIWLDGEAYFEVTRDKIRPFLVHTSDLDVRVHGTKFNLKAYDSEDIIEATLVEGLVSLETRNILGTKKEKVFLKPNHKAIYVKKKNAVASSEVMREITVPLMPKKIIITNPIVVEPSLSWREGKLVFMDESFENICINLERRYGVTIKIENDRIKKVRYTGVLKNISIEQALKAIQLTADFDFSINDHMVIISQRTSSKD